MLLYGSEAQDMLVSTTIFFLLSSFLEKTGSQTSILSLTFSGRLSLSLAFIRVLSCLGELPEQQDYHGARGVGQDAGVPCLN